MAKLKVTENFPLAPLTTFKLGGRARYFTSVKSTNALLDALDFADFHRLPTFFLGGGSNVLVNDSGFDGLVIHNGIKGISCRTEGDDAFVEAGAGEDWPGFVDWCVSRNLQGLECLAGIPGTVGASPVQNVGAYGQEVSDCILEVAAVDVRTGNRVYFRNEHCGFSYRSSIFNTTSAGSYCITGVTLRLRKNEKPSLAHGELRERLQEISDLTLKQVRDCTLDIREGKGLLLGKGRKRFRCAGSFFKNPVVPLNESGGSGVGLQKPDAKKCWPMGLSDIKISAAGLIQDSGFGPGFRKGNVGLSPKHALIVIAHRKATASEVLELAEEIQRKVMERFGILLRPEVRLIGFPPSPLDF